MLRANPIEITPNLTYTNQRKWTNFSQGLGKVEQYQSDGQASKIENSNQQRYFINKKGFKMLT